MRQLPEHETEVKGKWQQAKIPESLLKPAQEKMDKAEYKKELDKLSKKIADTMRFDKRNVVIAFEGWMLRVKGVPSSELLKT